LVRRSSTSEGGSDEDSSAVIPGWSEGPDLRCAIAHRGISRFRVRSLGSRPGMTGIKTPHVPSRHRRLDRATQYPRAGCDGIEKPRRTGYTAGACHRARRRRDSVAGYDDRWSEERRDEGIPFFYRSQKYFHISRNIVDNPADF